MKTGFYSKVKKQDPAKQCHGKVKHATIHDAKKALLMLDYAIVMNAYRCPHCSHWHLGKKAHVKEWQKNNRPLIVEYKR